ncbi:hypothetical protein [Paraburkholderia hayleyella]|uniref:hypothetical protein n=1 Tax=Paraburkholderia hayleyella TaxID=2152889 RepID=UPI0015800FCF|nr:hypothetical protein [Paraburkholderia hayleyella]
MHFEFMKELLARRVTPQGFFTVYYEHMFPGYNLILALNILLFRFWGGFDSVVYGLFIVAGAAIVVQRINADVAWPPPKRLVGLAVISLLLLSTTHNPMWGMGLAAAGGVYLFAICARILDSRLWGDQSSLWPFIVIFPIAQLLFLGGYGVGAVGSIGLTLLVRLIQDRKISISVWGAGVTVALSLVAYVAITTHYSSLTDYAPAASERSVETIIRFAIVMTGSSVLGKALFEQGASLTAYYVAGYVLILATVATWIYILRRPRTGAMFIFSLSAYSVFTVLAVSMFRYRNGINGAMAPWYVVHTQFIPIAAVWFLCEVANSRRRAVSAFAVMAFVTLCAVFGYHADWVKGRYVTDYKNKYVAEAPVILAFPETIRNRNDIQQTMLAHYDVVKPAIDFMYEHQLWIFKTTSPVVTGLTSDNWIEAERPVSIMCPSGTKSAHFKLWRKDGSAPSEVAIRAVGVIKNYSANGDVAINFPDGKPALLQIDASDISKSVPLVAPPDLRKIVAILSNVQCN